MLFWRATTATLSPCRRGGATVDDAVLESNYSQKMAQGAADCTVDDAVLESNYSGLAVAGVCHTTVDDAVLESNYSAT